MKNLKVHNETSQLFNQNEIPIECLHRRVAQSRHEIHAPHFHNYIEFLFAEEPCEVTVWVAGETVKMLPGDLIIINSGVAHDFFHILPMNRYICVKILPEVIYFSENTSYDVKYVIPFLQNRSISYRRFSGNELEHTGIPQAIVEMMEEWDKKEFGYEIALKSIFLKIFLWAIRHDGTGGGEENSFPEGERASYESVRLIQKSVEYMNRNFSEVTESEAAAIAGMSCSHYSRTFRAVMGKNFHEYLHMLRIHEAERLLLTTDLSVTEVALAVGFSTSSYFIERFRRVQHCTPVQYRRNFRKLKPEEIGT